MSKVFTAKTFAWLRQINHDHGLIAVDLKIAVELTDHFREKDQGGRAYPAAKTLGKGVGVSEQTTFRSIDRMVKRGHLYVIPGKPGRGYPKSVLDDRQAGGKNLHSCGGFGGPENLHAGPSENLHP